MKTWASTPARAAYAATAPPALPADGMVNPVAPSSTAFDTAADSPRALNEAVGLTPSSLISRLEQPSRAPRRSARAIGVNPSPRLITPAGLRTGISSK